MNNTISYKYFSNSNDFENWQNETNPTITSIYPIVASTEVQFNRNLNKKVTNSNSTNDTIIFVTYIKQRI